MKRITDIEWIDPCISCTSGYNDGGIPNCINFVQAVDANGRLYTMQTHTDCMILWYN